MWRNPGKLGPEIWGNSCVYEAIDLIARWKSRLYHHSFFPEAVHSAPFYRLRSFPKVHRRTIEHHYFFNTHRRLWSSYTSSCPLLLMKRAMLLPSSASNPNPRPMMPSSTASPLNNKRESFERWIFDSFLHWAACTVFRSWIEPTLVWPW